MSLVDRSKLLKVTGRRYVEVEIEGLGVVRLQSLTELEATGIESRTLVDGQVDRDLLDESYAYTITLMLVNADGARLLNENDIDTIRKMDAAIVQQLYAACEKHMAGKSLESAVKNSPKTAAAA